MDIQHLMRQAQEMQRKMQKAQEELANSLFEGISGGGMVKITVTGVGMAKKVSIDPSLMQESEREVLEDLIVAAINDAKDKVDNASSGSIKSATSGMALPPGFKL